MRTPLTLGLLAALQLLGGLVGQLVVLRIVGIGWETDAYIASQTLPLLVTAVVAVSLQSLWLPRFARAADSHANLYRDLQIATGQTLKVMLALVIPLSVSAGLWSRLAFPGFTDLQHGVVFQTSAPLFAAAGFNAMAGVLTAALRAQDKYYVSEVVALSATLIALIGIAILVPRYGVIAAAWLSAMRGLILMVALYAKTQRPTPTLRASEPSREVARQVRPLIAAGVFIKSGPLVDRYWGSKALGGEMTLLSVAQLALNSLATILERALLARALPQFAKQLAAGGPSALRLAYRACLRRILLSVMAVLAALLAISPIWQSICTPLLRISDEAAQQLWLLCLALIPSLFVAVAGSAAVAVFYAFGETRLPTMIGMSGFLLGVILKSFLFLHHGIVGVAIGGSLSLVVNMLLYHVAVEYRLSRHTR